MENTLIFASEKEVQFGKLLKFIIPTYLTSLFNTVYAHRFFAIAPLVIYALTYFLAPVGVSCFANTASPVFPIAVSGMRIYGLGFLFSGINIYAAVRMMAYGKGYFSGLITFLRSFALLLLFLTVLPQKFGLTGVWLAVPAAEVLTLLVAVWFLRPIQR